MSTRVHLYGGSAIRGSGVYLNMKRVNIAGIVYTARGIRL